MYLFTRDGVGHVIRDSARGAKWKRQTAQWRLYDDGVNCGRLIRIVFVLFFFCFSCVLLTTIYIVAGI